MELNDNPSYKASVEGPPKTTSKKKASPEFVEELKKLINPPGDGIFNYAIIFGVTKIGDGLYVSDLTVMRKEVE